MFVGRTALSEEINTASLTLFVKHALATLSVPIALFGNSRKDLPQLLGHVCMLLHEIHNHRKLFHN